MNRVIRPGWGGLVAYGLIMLITGPLPGSVRLLSDGGKPLLTLAQCCPHFTVPGSVCVKLLCALRELVVHGGSLVH